MQCHYALLVLLNISVKKKQLLQFLLALRQLKIANIFCYLFIKTIVLPDENYFKFRSITSVYFNK